MADFIDVSGLLYPKSIAVIGASGRAGNLGGDPVQHLVRFGFPGKVWVVNPDGRSVHGVRCLPQDCRPAGGARSRHPGNPRRFGRRDDPRVCGARHAPWRGVRRWLRRLRRRRCRIPNELGIVCRDVGFTLCGPNCVGIINAATPVTADLCRGTIGIRHAAPGPISMVTQSGGIGSTIFSMVQRAGFGFRHLISSGNEAVVRFADYLYALPATTARASSPRISNASGTPRAWCGH